jgi:glycine/D-amino acid oxidase-like deaminating enzyme
MSSRKRIMICGGGAIGAAIAYFTSRRGAEPIVIERREDGNCSTIMESSPARPKVTSLSMALSPDDDADF